MNVHALTPSGFLTTNNRRVVKPVVSSHDDVSGNSGFIDGLSRTGSGGNKSECDSIAHKILQLEAKANISSQAGSGLSPANVSSCTQVLDSFIRATKENLSRVGLMKSDLTFDEQQKAIQVIDETLTQEGFNVVGAVDSKDRLLTQALINKTYQCTSGSILVVSANEALGLGLPISIANVRDHTFVRLDNGTDAPINWDVQLKELQTDQQYLDDFDLTDRIPQESNYMKGLSTDEIIAHTHNDIGSFWKGRQQFTTAENHFRAALKANPNSYETYNFMTEMYYRRGDFAKAVQTSKQGLGIFPDCPELYVSQAAALEAQRKVSQAITCLEKAIELYPRLYLAHLMKALLEFGKLGRRDDAIKTMDNLVAAYPNNHNAYQYRAEFRRQTGNRSGQIQDMQKASQLIQQMRSGQGPH